MGWTGTHRPYGQSLREFFEDEFDKSKIVDFAVVERRTAYIAYKTENCGVVALIILLQFNRGHHNIYYKDMDETCGPCDRDCPERILKLLSPTDSEYALKWRAQCWQNIKDRKAFNKIWKKAEPGWVLSFDEYNKKDRYWHVKEDVLTSVIVQKVKHHAHVRGISGYIYKMPRTVLRKATLFTPREYVEHVVKAESLEIPKGYSTEVKYRINVGEAVYYPLNYDGKYGITCVASLFPGDPATCDIGCVPWTQLAHSKIHVKKLSRTYTSAEVCNEHCPVRLQGEIKKKEVVNENT